MHLSRLKTSAGLVALASFGVLLFTFGRPVAAAFSLPLPRLSFSDGISLSGVNVAPYQENPTLIIPAIALNVPIIKNVSVTDADQYDDALKDGVAHGKGSAPLDDSTGNSFIFGHSSNLNLHHTSFDTVFASLPNLRQGDAIQIVTGGRTEGYTVQESQAINSSDVQYLAASERRTITLVTCWPLGTNLKRWVVQATKDQ